MRTPSPWEAVLLAGAAYRLWRLAAEDDITEPLRVMLPASTDDFVECPWCLGFWITAGVWGSWQFRPDATVALAAPLALSAAVGEMAGRAALRYASSEGGE